MSQKHLALLAIVVALLVPRDPALAQLPRFELSTGVGWPRSGALKRYWGVGPCLGLQWLASAPRGVFSALGFRYNYFDKPSDAGYGTHGLRVSWALHARPAPPARFDVQAGAGVGGLWTSPSYSMGGEEVRTPDWVGSGGPAIGKIHGWGPTVEAGLGIVLLEDEATGGRATLRALWVRTWASDTFLDQLTVEMAWGLR